MTTLHVVATAGHVDHGKSSLIARLTGIDPDRLAEEKRRGLTIDLGFAWFTLASGREIGFVDVPGHERFIRNMLAGVGPLRLVLFVVAADEGWKPQSEEHLQIVDVLGADGAVVALTKSDLVDQRTLGQRTQQVVERLAGTRLESAPIVACSAATGDGTDDVRDALDAMVAAAPLPEVDGRPRQFLDRVFTMHGSGTVVTGTLTGGPIAVGQEVEVQPSGHRARIRGLQTHKRPLDVATPVRRLAVNLSGTPRENLERGDVLCLPGQWRPTATFDAVLRPVRGLVHRLSSRGAYKLYAGSAERDVRLRFVSGGDEVTRSNALIRVTARRPVVLDVGDRFVLREAGRQETVAGGVVLDPEPPRRWDEEHAAMLRARQVAADRAEVAELLVRERRFIRASDVTILTGAGAEAAVDRGAIRLGRWLTLPAVLADLAERLTQALAVHHQEHPLRPGLEIGEARALLGAIDPHLNDPGLADAVVDHLEKSGQAVRTGNAVRLPTHLASTAGRDDAARLIETVRAAEPAPPTIKELEAAGFARELVDAACADGRLVRVSPELVMTPELVAQAERIVRSGGDSGTITVSSFRQALGTSRKYALPLLEYFDGRGLTRRQGDVRVVRN
jgi:selenocysteine-specific elongation factor